MAFLSLKKRGKVLAFILITVAIIAYFFWPKENVPSYQTQIITRGELSKK